MRQGSSDEQVGVVEFADLCAEQSEPAQHGAAGVHRHRVHRGEAGFDGRINEPRPPWRTGVQIRHADRLPSDVAIQVRALVSLELEQLQITGFLRGGRHQVQVPARVGEQLACRCDIEELCAMFGEHRQ